MLSFRAYLLCIFLGWGINDLSLATKIATFESQEQPLDIFIIPNKAITWGGPDSQILTSGNHNPATQGLISQNKNKQQSSDPGLILPPSIKGQDSRFTKIIAGGSILYDGSYRLGDSSSEMTTFFPVQRLFTGVSSFDIAQTNPVGIFAMEDNFLDIPQNYTFRINSLFGERLTLSGSSRLTTRWKLKYYASRSIRERNVEWWNNKGTPLIAEDDRLQTLKHFSSQSSEVGLALTRKSGPLRFGIYSSLDLRESAIPNPSYETRWPESQGHPSPLYQQKRLHSQKHNTLLSLTYTLDEDSCSWHDKERIERCEEAMGVNAQNTNYQETISSSSSTREGNESSRFARFSIFLKKRPLRKLYFFTRLSWLENRQESKGSLSRDLEKTQEFYAGLRFTHKRIFSDLGYRRTRYGSKRARENKDQSFGYKARLGFRQNLFYAYADKSKDLSAPDQEYLQGDLEKGINPNILLKHESIDYSALTIGSDTNSINGYLQAYTYKNENHIFLAPSSFGFSKAQQRNAVINGYLLGIDYDHFPNTTISMKHAQNTSEIIDSNHFHLPGIPDYYGSISATWNSNFGSFSGAFFYTGRSYLDQINLQQSLPSHNSSFSYSRSWNSNSGMQKSVALSVFNILGIKHQEIEFSNSQQSKKGKLSFRQHSRIPELGRELQLSIGLSL